MFQALRDTTLRVAVLTAVVCSVATALYTLAQLEPAPGMSIVITFAPVITVILWLQKDAQRTGIGAVHDWGMFVWLAWPIVIPWYAFRSRGPSGWRLLLGLSLLICSASVTAFAAAWLMWILEANA